MRWDDVASVGFMAASIWLGTQTLNSSMTQWRTALEEEVTWQDVQQELLAAGGIDAVHNEVYAELGSEAVWEDRVKPAFLQRVSRRMVQDLGTQATEQDQVDVWLRANRAWIQETLRTVAREAMGGEGS